MPVRQEASANPLYSDLHDNILVHAYVTLIKTTFYYDYYHVVLIPFRFALSIRPVHAL